jgi:hypothetical protein
MPLIKFPDGQDYGAIYGYNQDGWLQFAVIEHTNIQVKELNRHLTDIGAQFIHKYIKLDVAPKDRQDSEWFLSERVRFLELGANPKNVKNAAIKCILTKSWHLILQTGEEFPLPGPSLISIDQKTYKVSKSFIDSLHELGKNRAAIGRLLYFATDNRNPVKIELDDAEICLGEELREIFERRRDIITIKLLTEIWEG